MSTNYSTRFKQEKDVSFYESVEYGPEAYSTAMWRLQRTDLERLVQEFRHQHPGHIQLLDFACGTGRVLSHLETFVDTAAGVDISESMVALARQKCTKASLSVGDIQATPELLQGPYDVISCFRFVLNVEPAIRARILRQLRTVIREPDGRLLINVHGNSRSLRHPAILWKRWRRPQTPGAESMNTMSVMLNEMSPGEAKNF